MKVYAVYNGDGWLSTDSLNLVAICTSKEKAKELILEDLKKNYDVVSINDVSEGDYDEGVDYLEDYADELDINDQILDFGFGYTLREVDTDEIL